MTNKRNLPYYIFTLIVIFLALFFFNSRKIFGDDRKNLSSNYDITCRTATGGYNFKFTNACIDKATNTMFIDYFIKGTNEPKEYPPEIFNITNGNVTGDKLKFIVAKNTEREFAYKVTVSKVPKKFEFIRLYIKSKGFDTKGEDTIDEFGNVVKLPDIPGKETEIWVNIDYRDIIFFDSSKGETPPTLNTVDLSTVDKVIEEKENKNPLETTTSTNIETTSQTQKNNSPIVSSNVSSGNKSPDVTQSKSTQQVSSQVPQVTTQPSQQTTTPKVKTTTTTTIAIKINTISLSSTFQNNNVVLNVNQTTKITPVISPTSATNKTLIWTSNKPQIASVDSNGIVTAHSPGKAIITAKTTDGSNLEGNIMVTIN